jgi:positive regulator of sigma E activity
VLLFTAKKIPFYVYLIPLLWSLVGMSAALNLGVPEDYGLAIAGVGGTVLLWMHNRKLKQKQEK